MKIIWPIILALGFVIGSCASHNTVHQDSDSHTLYLKAQDLYGAGDYDRAGDILNDLLSDYPNDPNVNHLLGMSFAQKGGIMNRKYALQFLKAAVNLEPDSLDWQYDLGCVLYEADTKYTAYLCFKAIIEADSNYLDAYLRLFDICHDRYKHNANVEKLAEGYQTVRTACKRFPLNTDLIYKQALTAMLLKNPKEAEILLAGMHDPDTLRAEIILLNAYLKYRAREYEQSLNLFNMGIALLPLDASRGYYDISLLLSPSQKSEYDILSESMQKRYRDSLWDVLDLDMTTEVNEKMVEHYARVYYSELLFSDQRRDKHGWETDRGKLCIRYGEPAFQNWNLAPGDVWSLSSFDINWSNEWMWGFMIDGRIEVLKFIDLIGWDNYQLAPIGEGSFDRKAHELVTATPTQPSIEWQTSTIEAYFSYFIYKGEDGESMVDVFIATPYDQLKYVSLEGHAACQVEYRAALLDLNGQALGRQALEQQYVISPTLSENPEFYHSAKVSLTAPPESLFIACAIEQKSAGKRSTFQIPIEIYDFGDAGFHLTGLILASKIARPEEGSVYNRGDYKLVPNFNNTYEESDTLIIYYEMYDLPTDLRGLTRYRLTYTISEIKPPGNLFSFVGDIFSSGKQTSITHTSEMGDRRTEILAPLQIDLSSLGPGLYEFTLTIDELILGKTLTRKTQFSIVDRSIPEGN
jgi:GWxTD domain-containing protein